MKFSFFHQSVRIRRYHNSITTIHDNNGSCFNDATHINNIVVNHFSNLWINSDTRSLDWFLNALPSYLPTLSNEHHSYLNKPISKDEIYSTLYFFI